MKKIGYKEYLDALEKVNLFHVQLKNEELVARAATENPQIKNIKEYVLDVLKKHSNIRTVNALSLFLESEIKNRKIPFLSPAEVPCEFFVEQYAFGELKNIRGIGINSFLSLQKILQEAGFTLLI